jgi:hypothetical protein
VIEAVKWIAAGLWVAWCAHWIWNDNKMPNDVPKAGKAGERERWLAEGRKHE